MRRSRVGSGTGIRFDVRLILRSVFRDSRQTVSSRLISSQTTSSRFASQNSVFLSMQSDLLCVSSINPSGRLKWRDSRTNTIDFSRNQLRSSKRSQPRSLNSRVTESWFSRETMKSQTTLECLTLLTRRSDRWIRGILGVRLSLTSQLFLLQSQQTLSGNSSKRRRRNLSAKL